MSLKIGVFKNTLRVFTSTDSIIPFEGTEVTLTAKVRLNEVSFAHSFSTSADSQTSSKRITVDGIGIELSADDVEQMHDQDDGFYEREIAEELKYLVDGEIHKVDIQNKMYVGEQEGRFQINLISGDSSDGYFAMAESENYLIHQLFMNIPESIMNELTATFESKISYLLTISFTTTGHKIGQKCGLDLKGLVIKQDTPLQITHIGLSAEINKSVTEY